jgi:SAM-dependent methyltransferase
MKLCLACHTSFIGLDWKCPACGHAPREIDGWTSFAPELALSNDGMAPDAHHGLDNEQEKSFWFRSRNKLIADLAVQYFSQAQNALEVGCGTGYVLSGLQSILPGLRLIGSEIYLNGLPYARRRLGSEVELYQMDARRLPFAEEFDLICAFDVLEHITEDSDALDSMFRALRPGGGVLLSVPQHPFLWSRADEIAFHKRRYRRGELESKCRTAGLRVLRSTSFVSILMPAMLAQRGLRGNSKDYEPQAELNLPRYLDQTFNLLLDIERRLIKLGLNFPFGGSRFIVARKD